MPGSAGRKGIRDLSGRAGHMLNRRTTNIRDVDGAATQNNNALFSIRPFFEGQHLFKGISSDYQYVHARDELIISVGLTPAFRKEVKIAIASCDEAVNACTYEDGCPHMTTLDSLAHGHIGPLLCARQFNSATG